MSNGILSTTDTVTVAVIHEDDGAAGGGGGTVLAAPIANAGADQNVASGDAVTIDGSASSDPNTPAQPLAFLWVQTMGESVTLATSTEAIMTFTAPTLAAGDSPVTLGFTLTVSNSTASATTTVMVIVQ